jgi:hypothetical protein
MPANGSEIIHNRYLSFEASLLEVFVGLVRVLSTTSSVAVHASLVRRSGARASRAADTGRCTRVEMSY